MVNDHGVRRRRLPATLLSGALLAGTVVAQAGPGSAASSAPPLPSIFVDDPFAVEGSGTVVFTVRLGRASTTSVTVWAATADGTATAGADYAAVAPRTLTFAPGVTSVLVPVSVVADVLAEPTETLRLDLSAPVGGVVGDAKGQASVLDDEVAPRVSVDDPLVVEGPLGSRASLAFTVSLSAPPAPGQSATVRVRDLERDGQDPGRLCRGASHGADLRRR